MTVAAMMPTASPLHGARRLRRKLRESEALESLSTIRCSGRRLRRTRVLDSKFVRSGESLWLGPHPAPPDCDPGVATLSRGEAVKESDPKPVSGSSILRPSTEAMGNDEGVAPSSLYKTDEGAP